MDMVPQGQGAPLIISDVWQAGRGWPEWLLFVISPLGQLPEMSS